MSDLDRLIEAVETGTLPEQVFLGCSSIRGHWAYTTGLDPVQRKLVFLAYNGSVDAAIYLCDVLLPGWNWGRMNDRMFVEQGDSVFSERAPNPARALLLAVLRAKLMETSHDPH